MTRDETLALMARRNAAWLARDAAALAATHAPSGVVVSPTGGVLEGRAEIERVYRLLFSAFSDLVWQPRELLIDGDRIVQIARLTGTHTGDFFGMTATGRQAHVEVALVIAAEDGLVTEERRIYDFTGLLIQVGVLKAKPGA
jgi:uncharacterized protein (TIGR02246 family)